MIQELTLPAMQYCGPEISYRVALILHCSVLNFSRPALGLWLARVDLQTLATNERLDYQNATMGCNK